MTTPTLENIDACVFDAYGTLFDFNSAAQRCRDVLGDKADDLSAVWRTKQLQYTWLRALMGEHAPFWQVTGEALDFAMDSLDIDDQALRDRLMDLYLHIDAFPEVVATLKVLKEAGLKTAILSNGSPEMLAAAVENTGTGPYLDAVLSVEDVGIFKPHPSVYQLACDRLGVDAANISFQSSNSWDAVGAANFGMRVVWINRYGQGRERLGAQPDVELSRMDELPAIVGAA
jgi:2-haloacid dehalogenase